ncbi:MAG: DUF1926 domain-containing protein, partial [Candidatus Krumholzibacteria bacterium]|nr:DUF1926 domain-containing protein [Candidatus Krumholzibacteria bacterium]
DAAGEARRHLYQAQCNCAYWHGLFGGLYLPHLRSAVFKHIIAAEAIVRLRGREGETGPLIERGDIDGDGVEEIVVSTSRLQAFFKARGGALRELDLIGPRFNLTDTLTRREEIYHRDLLRLAEGGGTAAGSAVSIHDVAAAKEEGLEKRLQYDRWPRVSLADRFIEAGAVLEPFAASAAAELGDFVDGLYDISSVCDEGGPQVVLERTGAVSIGGRPVGVRLEKRVSIPDDEPAMTVRYRIAAGGGLSCRFAVENVFSMLAGDAPDRYFRIPGRTLGGGANLASTGEEEEVSTIMMVDEWLGLALRIDLEPAARLWRFPIETVSNSDAGFERVYQGSAVVPVWDLDLEAGEEANLSLVLTVDDAGAGS